MCVESIGTFYNDLILDLDLHFSFCVLVAKGLRFGGSGGRLCLSFTAEDFFVALAMSLGVGLFGVTLLFKPLADSPLILFCIDIFGTLRPVSPSSKYSSTIGSV